MHFFTLTSFMCGAEGGEGGEVVIIGRPTETRRRV